MGTKIPIDVKALKRAGAVNPDAFFQLLSEQCNYISKKQAQDFYLGLVRTVTKELREKGVCQLPHMGYFALVKRAPKASGVMGTGVAGAIRGMVGERYTLIFYPTYPWRDYFAKLGQQNGREGRLDPREKVLGQDLG